MPSRKGTLYCGIVRKNNEDNKHYIIGLNVLAASDMESQPGETVVRCLGFLLLLVGLRFPPDFDLGN